MNEITHEQARRLMQQAVDGLLDEGGFARQEWANLHAHLEHCPTCRAEERALRALARELHGVVRHGLDQFEPPQVKVRTLVDRRAILDRARKWMTRFAVAIPAILLLIFIGIIVRPDQLVVAMLDPWGTAAEEFYASFDGQIAFVSKRDGNDEIYLLQGDSSPVNLTNNPKEDTMPVWSPDGAWLTFYSDRAADPLNARAQEPRSTAIGINMLSYTPTPADGKTHSIGKREIFLIDMADPTGAPVQISAEPAIAWQSPPAWSPDGKSLVIDGRIGEATMEMVPSTVSDTWLFRLGLDGTPAQRIEGTQGASYPRFSPNGRWVGYFQDSIIDSAVKFLSVDDYAAGKSILFVPEPSPGNEYIPGETFAWSPGGGDLTYIVNGPFFYGSRSANRAVSQLRRTRGSPERLPDPMAGGPLIEMPVGNGLRDVSWSPDATTLVVLQGSEQDPCLSLLIGRAPREAGAQMDIYPVEGLCAEEMLSARPWTPDGRWLIFTGRWHGGASNIYALDVKQVVEHPNSAPLVARLTETNSVDSQPQVRPEFLNLRLEPQPAADKTVAQPIGVDLRKTAPGRLLVTGSREDTDVDIFALAPSGKAPTIVSDLPGNESSPVWAPGGRRAAWISSPDQITQSEHLYVGDLRELKIDPPDRQLLSVVKDEPPKAVPALDLTPGGALSISAPTWSPDGLTLAVVLNFGRVGFSTDPIEPPQPSQIAIYSADGDTTKNNYISPRGITFMPYLAWSPPGSKAGQHIAALVTGDLPGRAAGSPLALALVDLAWGGQDQALLIYHEAAGIQPDQVRGLAFSPDGKQVALLALVEQNGRWIPRVVLFDVTGEREPQASQAGWFEDYTLPQAEDFQEYAEVIAVPFDGLSWRPGSGEISFIFNNPRTSPAASSILLYNTAGGAPLELGEWPERIFQHRWSPDGAWLAFNTESGLYLVNVEAARQGEAPLRLINQVNRGFDWGP